MIMQYRSISTTSLLFASVSAIFGSGWLFVALYAAQSAGPSALLAWVIGGILVIIIAYTYAEISAMLPITGVTSRIPQYTHGTIVSYLYAWIIWLSYIALAPTEVQAVIQYLSYFYPTLTYANGGLTVIGYIVAGALLLGISILNVIALRWLIRCNNFLTLIKIILPIGLSIVMLSLLFSTQKVLHTNHADFFTYGTHGLLSAISTGGIIFAFNGFKQASEMAGEAANPARAIPIAIVGSVVLCLIIYLLLQMTFLSSLNSQNLMHGFHALHLPGKNSPLAAIIAQNHVTWLLPFLYFAAIVGPLAAGLMYASSSARALFAMSKNDFLPKIFEKRNQHGHPWIAVLACFILGMLCFAPLPGLKNMINFLASLMAISYSITPICLLTLRKQVPTYQRPLRLPCVTLWAGLAFYCCNLLIYWSGWAVISKLSWCLLASVILLFVYHYTTERGRQLTLHYRASLWIWPYFAGITLLSYLGNFGGGTHAIPFGWDMAVIAIFSASILYLAVKYRLPDTETAAHLSQLNIQNE